MENFTLRETKIGPIVGYHWPVKEAKCVVCIVHGMGEYAGRYERVVSGFNEAGFAVMSMDLRGHGLSPGKRGDCSPRDEVLEDISTLISTAARKYEGLPLIIYGHSMGGNLVLDYRRRGVFRDIAAGYIVSSPWVRLIRPISEPLHRTIRTISKILPTLTMGANIDETKLGDLKTILPYREDSMIHNRISLRCAIDGFEIGTELEKATDPARAGTDKIREIPTLLMHGSEDQICDIEGTRAVYENGKRRGENIQFIEWTGFLHELHNGSPERSGSEVVDRMIEFIFREALAPHREFYCE